MRKTRCGIRLALIGRSWFCCCQNAAIANTHMLIWKHLHKWVTSDRASRSPYNRRDAMCATTGHTNFYPIRSSISCMSGIGMHQHFSLPLLGCMADVLAASSWVSIRRLRRLYPSFMQCWNEGSAAPSGLARSVPQHLLNKGSVASVQSLCLRSLFVVLVFLAARTHRDSRVARR